MVLREYREGPCAFDARASTTARLCTRNQTCLAGKALRLFTVSSAWCSREEGRKGVVAPGQLADLAALSEDYFSVPAERIRVTATTFSRSSFGASRLWVAYGSTQDGRCSIVGGAPCTTGGLGASEWVAGYTYNFNKYLDLNAVFYDIRNRTSGTCEPVSALNVPLNTTPAPGLNIRSFGGSVLLTF